MSRGSVGGCSGGGGGEEREKGEDKRVNPDKEVQGTAGQLEKWGKWSVGTEPLQKPSSAQRQVSYQLSGEKTTETSISFIQFDVGVGSPSHPLPHGAYPPPKKKN